MFGNEFENEVSITGKTTHKNVVRLIGYCSHTEVKLLKLEGQLIFADVSERLICLEYMPNGTLEEQFGKHDITACPP